MTRMIERWFPCTEVSEAADSGWGSGKSERALFTWFAARPLAQAKAAVLTSLLPWPEDEPEQRRLQDLVRTAMTGRDSAHAELVAQLEDTYPGGASMLDPFSGRAMIPLEAARLGVAAHGVDYSPVATLAGQLLADYPLRNWDSEPPLPFGGQDTLSNADRILGDVRGTLSEIGRRYSKAMEGVYPKVDDRQPWGYLWAATLPCQECGNRFPLTGNLVLRHPLPIKNDPGQSYRIEADRSSRTWRVQVHEGSPSGHPTLTTMPGSKDRSKIAVCPFCDHVHATAVHRRLSAEGLREDALLLAADLDEEVGKHFRPVREEEAQAAAYASELLRLEQPFAPGLPAVPDEAIPAGNSSVIQPSAYGAQSYGQMCNERQTLGFVRLARVISELGEELIKEYEVSEKYAAALTGYASSVLVRKLNYSTRGAAVQPRKDPKSNRVMIRHIFRNEASIAFSYDYFESGLGDGPGTWSSLADDTVAVLRSQVGRSSGRPADIARGSAVALPWRDRSVSAVVTDPPYDEMVPYSDASDLFYVWLKRALISTQPWFSFTTDPDGVQEKQEEIIVKRFRAKRTAAPDHRTTAYYDDMIARAFAEARRVVAPDGVVTIVFGHGDPDVWHRLLDALTCAELVLTGSWPAKTESGGSAGSANIVTTLTMACRPAPTRRSPGRANLVEAAVKREIRARVPIWEAAGLALPDQRMASAGPAMEVVGRYSGVLDNVGEPVAPERYLLVARRAVDEAAAIEIDHLPLETFDIRTRFALSWVRDYRRSVAAKSEARWQALAADLEMESLRGVLTDVSKGVRLSTAAEFKARIDETSSVIDVAFALAKAWPEGLDAVGEVLLVSQRNTDDPFLWAAMNFLSSRLPEADPDAIAWAGLVRSRRAIGTTTREFASERRRAAQDAEARNRQGTLFDLNCAGTEDQ